MEIIDIYTSLQSKSIYNSSFLSRKMFVVKLIDFNNCKEHFDTKTNILNSGVNYRTKGIFEHLHAVEKGGLVFIHTDYGNIDKSLLMYPIHFVLDIIPYFTSTLLNRHLILKHSLEQAKISIEKEGSAI